MYGEKEVLGAILLATIIIIVICWVIYLVPD